MDPGPTISPAQWLGVDSSAIDFTSLERPLHRAVLEPLLELRAAAAAAGFELALASGYRDFDRQTAIWNGKARGERQVHDDRGRTVVMAGLSDTDKVEAIWRYSALPGTSRHHWGTDVDVYDRAAVPDDYPLRLTPAEFAPGGPFASFSRWLDERVASGASNGFFRPYRQDFDRGGIAPEPWHLSFAPLARHYEAALAPEPLAARLRSAQLELRETILADLQSWWQRFVLLPGAVYPSWSSA